MRERGETIEGGQRRKTIERIVRLLDMQVYVPEVRRETGAIEGLRGTEEAKEER